MLICAGLTIICLFTLHYTNNVAPEVIYGDPEIHYDLPTGSISKASSDLKSGERWSLAAKVTECTSTGEFDRLRGVE